MRKASRFPIPRKSPRSNGSMIDMPAMGATNWPPPSYDPQTELFYFNGTTGYGMAYLYDTSDKPEGYGGGGGGNFDRAPRFLPWTSGPGTSSGNTSTAARAAE